MDDRTRTAIRALVESDKQLDGVTVTSEVGKTDTLAIHFRGGGTIQVTGRFNLEADMPQPKVDTCCDGCIHYIHETSGMLNGNERCTPCMAQNSKQLEPQPQPSIHCEGCTYLKYNQAKTKYMCGKYFKPLLLRDADNAIVALPDCVTNHGKQTEATVISGKAIGSVIVRRKMTMVDYPGNSGKPCDNCGRDGAFTLRICDHDIHLCDLCVANLGKLVIEALL